MVFRLVTSDDKRLDRSQPPRSNPTAFHPFQGVHWNQAGPVGASTNMIKMIDLVIGKANIFVS